MQAEAIHHVVPYTMSKAERLRRYRAKRKEQGLPAYGNPESVKKRCKKWRQSLEGRLMHQKNKRKWAKKKTLKKNPPLPPVEYNDAQLDAFVDKLCG